MPGCPNHNGVSPILMEICTTLPPHITSMEKYKLDPQLSARNYSFTGDYSHDGSHKRKSFDRKAWKVPSSGLLAGHSLLKLCDGNFHQTGRKVPSSGLLAAWHTGYSNWVMSTIMATPSRRATTSIMLCLKVAPSRSSGITDTVAM